MPDDSSGNYSVPAGTIVNTGDTILPSQHNPWATDSASAISNRFSKDGRAPATGNWNLNNFRLTNMGDPVDNGDAVTKGYVDINQYEDIASASTTNIGSTKSINVRVTGSVTISSLGSAASGIVRNVLFSGNPILTYNAVSLILPGFGNILANSGDTATFVSEGSGNWRCISYNVATWKPYRWEVIASFSPVAASNIEVKSISGYHTIRVSGFLSFSTLSSIALRTSIDNMVTSASGATDYSYQILGASGAIASASGTTASVMVISGTTFAAAAFETTIFNFNKSGECYCVSNVGGDKSGSLSTEINFSKRNNNIARNAFVIFPSAGGTVTGTVVVEGLRG